MNQFRKQTQANTWHRAATNMPTSPRDTTMDDLKGLMAFAGATSDVVSNYLEDKTQEDALKQIESVRKTGKTTEDATVGGYRAAASLGIANWNQERNQRDIEFAKTNPSDEQLRERAMEEDRKAKEFLVGNYEYLKEDPELLKAVSMNTIEQMPNLAKVRETARLEQEQTKRLTALNERILMSSGMSPEQFPEMFKTITSELKIDTETAKAALIGTAVESGDLKLLELVAGSKLDDEGLPLGQKNGKLRQALQQAKSKAIRMDAGRIAKDRETLITQFKTGELTESEWMDQIKMMNEKYNGEFMSPEQAFSVMVKAGDEYSSAQRLQTMVDNAIANPTVNNTVGLRKEDKDALALSIYDTTLGDILFEIPEDQRTPEAITKAKAQAVKTSAELYAAQGLVNPKWDAMFTSAATVSPLSVISEQDGQEFIRPETLEALNAWSVLTPAQRAAYTGGANSTLLTNYDILTKAGSTPVEAMRAVNEIMMNPKPVQNKAFSDAAGTVIDDLFKPWFGRNISDSGEQYLSDEVQRRLHVIGRADEAAINYVKADIEANSTQLNNGQVILASTQDLGLKLGVHVDRVNDALVNFQKAMLPDLERIASVRGEDVNDFNFALDKNGGTVYLVDSVGFPIAGTFKSLKQIGDDYYQSQAIKRARTYETSESSGFGSTIFYSSPTKL